MAMTTQDWLNLNVELRRANAGRNLDCFALWNAYQGNLWNLTGSPLQQDRSGRIILRDTRRDWLALARDFGMTAASDARIPQDAPDVEESKEDAALRLLTVPKRS